MEGNQPYNAYLNLNVSNNKKYDEGATLFNIYAGAGCKLQQAIQVPDNTEHSVNAEMIAQSEDKIAIFGYLMTQYYLKAGMRKFGSRAEDATITELTQLHVMDAWVPEDPMKLSRVEK